MTGEELAVWITENRKELRRLAQLTCTNPNCSRPRVVAVLYGDSDGTQVLWTAGHRLVTSKGDRSKPYAVHVWPVPSGQNQRFVQVAAHCRACSVSTVLLVRNGLVSATRIA